MYKIGGGRGGREVTGNPLWVLKVKIYVYIYQYKLKKTLCYKPYAVNYVIN